MQIQIRNRCSDFNSYRAARVKSLFNAESGCNFDLDADIDLSGDWAIGVVVGPSGSGKTSIGRQIFGEPSPFWEPVWPADGPIIDAIAPEGDFNAVTGALGSVGLGSVPTWLRPYPVRSNRLPRSLRVLSAITRLFGPASVPRGSASRRQ